MSRTILLVEDAKPIREMLRFALERENYRVLEADCAAKGRDVLGCESVDLIMVDWMMPGESGVEMVRKLRKNDVYSKMPILMLTARVDEEDIVKGLEAGADDYLTKPVAIKELSARVKALLRRTTSVKDEKLEVGGIVLDLATRQLSIEAQSVHIGQTEFKLLRFFLENQNRVYTRGQLLDFIWGTAVYVEERTVDVHMLRLRKLFKPSGLDKLFTTVRGMGYMFVTSKDV
jgi:two-component system phosphate regulon response regulator PhoB